MRADAFSVAQRFKATDKLSVREVINRYGRLLLLLRNRLPTAIVLRADREQQPFSGLYACAWDFGVDKCLCLPLD